MPILYFLYCFCILFCIRAETLIPGQSLRQWQSLSSDGKGFTLGFFSPADSDNGYLGIWYGSIDMRQQTVVWVANRDDPLKDDTGEFAVKEDGNLAVLGSNGIELWKTNVSTEPRRSVVELWDSGNLVLREGSRIVWQSFDHPTDTLLPGMEIGVNKKTKETRNLTSWKSTGNPGSGSFSFGLKHDKQSMLCIWRKSEIIWKSGIWDGESFEGLYYLSDIYLLHFDRRGTIEDGWYFNYSSQYITTRLVMDLSGELQFLMWDGSRQSWLAVWSATADPCARACGPNSSCNKKNNPPCKCLPGFEPTSSEAWNSGNWSGGCRRRTPLDCRDENGFIPVPGVSLQGSYIELEGSKKEQCMEECRRNCACTAFSYVGDKDNQHVDDKDNQNSKCTTWVGDLKDVIEEAKNGLDFYLRVSASELERRCQYCGDTKLPYPLNVGPDCRESSYTIRCDNGIPYFVVVSGTYRISIFNSSTRTFIIELEEAADTCSTRDLLLNQSSPFHISKNNTILLQNCPQSSHIGTLNCNLSNPCYKYKREASSSCIDSEQCCSYATADPPSTNRSLGISRTQCNGYVSIVSPDLALSANSWKNGLEIVWDTPREPLCNSGGECMANSSCLSESPGAEMKRCICNVDFQWDPTLGICGDLKQSSSGNAGSRQRKMYQKVVPGIVAVSLVLVITCLGAIYGLWRRRIKQKEIRKRMLSLSLSQAYTSSLNASELGEDGKKGLDIPFIEFAVIAVATENYSDSNKLGQGGFGPVYKGILHGGRQVAVKRLSRSSGQGLQEFKNELMLIAKLQHRNLVRLLGYCIHGDEKMILYEYMANKSLDSFLFDSNQRKLLDWGKRFTIILGVARGLMYLHQDSRLRIIHRDLKTSNILLDEEMNPKISDFGMARMFGGKQTEANTNRVVGTYGYMAPEYALDGIFSVKSDVFSYGVVLLEIISGRKNIGYYKPEESLSLLGHAWQLWKEDRGLDVIDPTIKETCNLGEVFKCICIGLLCVQEDAADRPSMGSVVAMLVSENASLPVPKQPAFYIKSRSNTSSSSSKPEVHSQNELTFSTIGGR